MPPNTVTARAITFRVTRLHHEAFDHSVEDHIVVIVILSVGHEIFNGLGRHWWVQITENLTLRRVNDDLARQCILLLLLLNLRRLSESFIVHVTTLLWVHHGLPACKEVKSTLFPGCADKSWVDHLWNGAFAISHTKRANIIGDFHLLAGEETDLEKSLLLILSNDTHHALTLYIQALNAIWCPVTDVLICFVEG